ncbi:LysR family transcriptional regulator [Methylosinus sp. R-45379]|uniref:LysR family transcriptional regulator n=1 Tax=Methylosinus sp. R-45379 TaxID=980563 RepID=UPI0007C8E1F7|nr:LysR family transcriptional regulator [Methylosinus sp. R-45379]OAI30591.1 LysR family transcriptional regulator [Methylosinus sp. R-45379]
MSELRNFDLNLLITFDVLMEELSVSRAAERMYVTQSAMSHALQRLRQQFDDPLLVRGAGGMKPTERALSLAGPVKALLRDANTLIQEPESFDASESRRRFNIAATDYMDLLVAPLLMERIDSTAPGVDIHIKRTQQPFPEHDLEYGELDVVLGFDAVLKPATYLAREKLFEDRMVSVVRRGHPKSGVKDLTLDDYLAMKHMLISRTGTRFGVIDDWLAERGLSRRVALTVPHFLSAPLIVAQTDMELSLPERIANCFLAQAPLTILSLPIELPHYDLVMVWHPLRERDPAHRWLREQIVSVCRTLEASKS